MLEVSGLDAESLNTTCRHSWSVQVPCDRFGRVLREGLCTCCCRVISCIASNTHTRARAVLLIDPSARSALQQADTDSDQMFRRGYRGSARLPPTL